MSDPAIYYLIAHGGVTVVMLQQIMSINKRLGSGDSYIDILKKKCPYIGGSKGCDQNDKKEK
jgi:hypothetical protein